MKALLGREEKDDVPFSQHTVCCLLSHVAPGLVHLPVQLKVELNRQNVVYWM